MCFGKLKPKSRDLIYILLLLVSNFSLPPTAFLFFFPSQMGVEFGGGVPICSLLNFELEKLIYIQSEPKLYRQDVDGLYI